MKRILLFLMLFLLTGCSAEVVLKIDEEKIIETTKVYNSKFNVYDGNNVKQDISSYLEEFERDYEFYKINEFEENEYAGKTYDIEVPLEHWGEISILNPCYENFDFKETDTNISLNTSEENLCVYLYELKDVTLTIESDLDLISTNADYIRGNKLIWNINEDNYKNKSIQFDYSIINSKKNKENFQILIYILIIIGLAIGVFIFIKKKNKENNKI